MFGYTLALAVLGFGSYGRVKILGDRLWWIELERVAPLLGDLRTYWIITTVPLAICLVGAVIALLARAATAPLLVGSFLVLSMAINFAELALLLGAQRQLALTVSKSMGIAASEVGGLQAGIAGSTAELVYKVSCALFLLYSRQVRSSFNHMPLTRLVRWSWGK